MPIAILCGSCEAKLNAPDAAAGKRVKCPKCGMLLKIPLPEPEPDADFEVIADEPKPKPATKAPPPAKLKPKPVLLDESDEDEVDRPAAKKKPKPAVLEDEEARPVKKPAKQSARAADDEEDEDDTPRPKKKGNGKKVAPKSNRPLIIGGSVGGVLLLGLIVWLAFLRGGDGGTRGTDGRGGAEGGADTPRLKPVARYELPGEFAFNLGMRASFSADGLRLSFSGSQGFQKAQGYILDLTGEPKLVTQFPGSVAISPRGDTVVRNRTTDHEGGVFRLSDKTPLLKNAIHFNGYQFLDENRLFTFEWQSIDANRRSNSVTIRNLENGAVESEFKLPESLISDVHLTRDEKKLWLFMDEKKFEFQCWDFVEKRRLKTVTAELTDPSKPYKGCGFYTAISADGAVIFSMQPTEVGNLFFEAETGKFLGKLPATYQPNSDGFLAIGQIYAAGVKQDPIVKTYSTVLFDVKTMKTVAFLEDGNPLAVSRDGKRAVGYSNKAILVYDLSSLNLK